MFAFDNEKLERLGAALTTKEIAQQPKLWKETYRIYEDNKAEVQDFLAQAASVAGSDSVQVVFTGAGTSAYVGDTIVSYLTREGDKGFSYAAIATTDIVCAPEDYLVDDRPTILVSFARSGNSPESLAAVERAGQVVDNIWYLNITCAPEGRLAQAAKDDPKALTLLLPFANDQGFAMTGSYSCMELLATLIFDAHEDALKETWVNTASSMGQEVLEREVEISALLDVDFDRITYLGSSSFSGLAREAQLKVLELAGGRIATSFDSSMGYRHGPKSFVDGRTIVFDFVHNNPYTRQYDLDILNEIAADGIAAEVVAIQQPFTENFDGLSFTFDKDHSLLPQAYLALPFVMVAQTVSLLVSVKVGNTPDTPCATGAVNRVVKGVTIHPYACEN